MKILVKMLSATLFISLTTTTHAQHVISGTGSEAIFPKSKQAPASNFTGTAWVQLLAGARIRRTPRPWAAYGLSPVPERTARRSDGIRIRPVSFC